MSALLSFPDGFRALVIGASGGIGQALISQLRIHPRCSALYAASRGGLAPDGVTGFALDLTRPETIAPAIAGVVAEGPLHLVITATGILHDSAGGGPEKSFRQIRADHMMEVFAINTIGPALLARAVLPHLALGTQSAPEKAVFAALSARVGSISDNRSGGWHSYRASKAGLNQILKTCAIELARRAPHAVCIGLHPGTVDTALSRPFQANVPRSKLFVPAHSAARLLDVIDTIDADRTGRVFDWSGAEIAP